MAQSTLIRGGIVPLKKATVPAAVQYGIWHSFNDIETALLWSSATTNIALSPATATVIGVTDEIAPGTAQVAASPATVTTTPVAPSVSAAVSVSQAPATITTTGVAQARTTTVDVTATPAAITVTGIGPTRIATILPDPNPYRTFASLDARRSHDLIATGVRHLDARVETSLDAANTRHLDARIKRRRRA